MSNKGKTVRFVAMDANLMAHHKVRTLVSICGPLALIWHLAALGYSEARGMNGRIYPDHLLRIPVPFVTMSADERTLYANACEEVKLWDREDEHWVIHNWAKYNRAGQTLTVGDYPQDVEVIHNPVDRSVSSTQGQAHSVSNNHEGLVRGGSEGVLDKYISKGSSSGRAREASRNASYPRGSDTGATPEDPGYRCHDCGLGHGFHAEGCRYYRAPLTSDSDKRHHDEVMSNNAAWVRYVRSRHLLGETAERGDQR